MTTPPATALRFKANAFTLTVLQVIDPNLSAIETALDEKLKQSPDFFQNAPVMIDLSELSDEREIDLKALTKQLYQRGLLPVGIRAARSSQTQQAKQLHLALFQESHIGKPSFAKTAQETPSSSPLVISKPVRSGQQVYAKQADLVVLSSVSAGAELLADGSIHVYGTLRGRALAGVKGDTNAQIFCQSLQAELVSVAGNYRLIEELKSDSDNQAVQIRLDERDRLIISHL
ncbi:MAG: septum site-determining protein MinC [Gammaproteobacteria bacterium]|nr:septum site-determining protein MinC [Gammaproteobacteria bacterium]